MSIQLEHRVEPADSMNQQGRRIQEIVEQIGSVPDPATRELMQECVASVLSFCGEGLERVLQIVKRSGIEGQRIHEELIRDRIVSGLLLIHGIHPVDIETRLKEALEKIRPYMKSHGGDVELLGLQDDMARLRLSGSCKSCPSSAVTMELAVRHALEEACPDLVGFEVEGSDGGLAISNPEVVAPDWLIVEDAQDLEEGGIIRAEVAGVQIVVCRAGNETYAYHDRCPVCNIPLHLGSLEHRLLTCLEGHRFSLQNAGRSPDDRALRIEPIPLVREDGLIKAAMKKNGAVPVQETNAL